MSHKPMIPTNYFNRSSEGASQVCPEAGRWPLIEIIDPEKFYTTEGREPDYWHPWGPNNYRLYYRHNYCAFLVCEYRIHQGLLAYNWLDKEELFHYLSATLPPREVQKAYSTLAKHTFERVEL